LTDKKKSVFPSKQFVGQLHKEYSTQEERFNNISNWTLDIILSIKEPIVFLEDYSYASKGMIFSIGENTGALKSKLWLAKIPFILVQPSKVKKTFSGKGNANKEAMYTEFVKQTNMDLLKYYSSITNPASDIVDSYAIYKYGMSNYK
jgi:Holliday junction resolvasome RuvABC endonuclease subunit